MQLDNSETIWVAYYLPGVDDCDAHTTLCHRHSSFTFYVKVLDRSTEQQLLTFSKEVDLDVPDRICERHLSRLAHRDTQNVSSTGEVQIMGCKIWHPNQNNAQ
jgi:hypothetical protein